MWPPDQQQLLPGYLSEMYILGPQLGPAQLETLGVGPSNLHCNKPWGTLDTRSDLNTIVGELMAVFLSLCP